MVIIAFSLNDLNQVKGWRNQLITMITHVSNVWNPSVSHRRDPQNQYLVKKSWAHRTCQKCWNRKRAEDFLAIWLVGPLGEWWRARNNFDEWKDDDHVGTTWTMYGSWVLDCNAGKRLDTLRSLCGGHVSYHLIRVNALCDHTVEKM